MRSSRPTPHSATRLFGVLALIGLVPIVVLGLVMARTYQNEAAARGLAEGQAQAALLAATTIAPLLDGHDLRSGVTPAERRALAGVAARTSASGSIPRLRVRDLDGRVVFSGDGSGFNQTPEDEAVDAAGGDPVALLTRLNSDANDTGPAGEQVVEIYRAVDAGPQQRKVGVLEMYLPYAPIADDINAGAIDLYRDLALGLAVLYVVLAGLALFTTRRLRRHALENAYLAEHDPLTGLPNRRVFQQDVEALLTSRGAATAAVAVMDLDRFKEVNDSLGHHNGDELLIRIGALLSVATRPGDVVARLGGDEFGVILHRVTSEADAAAILHRLLSAVAEPIELDGLPLAVEASIGFALTPDDGHDAVELLQHADIAMYVAKAGHLGVVRYDPAQDHFDADRLAVVGELRRALVNDELVLHFQPKLDLRDGRVHAVEALIRWNHPRHGLLMPDSFLPVAEQTGLIDPLTDWVVACALAQLTAWHGEGVDLSVAVNVSARNLTQAAFADRVLTALDLCGAPAERLLLEITETALFTDLERATRTMSRFSDAGVRLSLDDFGQGQTSLGFLARLPIDELKIDRAFVTDLRQDPAHAAIVRSLVDLAHNLGFVVVAEGAEDDSTIVSLREMDCDAAQGFGIARPMPAPTVAGWLAAQVPMPVA